VHLHNHSNKRTLVTFVKMVALKSVLMLVVKNSIAAIGIAFTLLDCHVA